MPNLRFKHRHGLRLAPILSGLLAVAFLVFAPTALGAPGDEQYNFDPPSAGDDGGETATGGPTGSSSGTGLPPAAGLSPNTADDKSGGKGKANETGEGSGGPLPGSTLSTSTSPSDEGSGSSDGGLFSAITDTIGLGMMPILLAAMAAIAIGGVSLALYRRRDRHAEGEPV